MAFPVRSLLALATAICCAGFRSVAPSKTYKVRLLFIRHGLSCANSMDACTFNQEKATATVQRVWPRLNEALQSRHPEARLREDYGDDGVLAANASDPLPMCNVRIVDPSRQLREGIMDHDGDVFWLQFLYRDPILTDCSLFQSIQAGSALLDHLASHKVRVRGVFSSMLLRTMETAYAMLLDEHHSKSKVRKVLTGGASRRGVVPVPFMLETYAHSSVQLDNTPFDPETQAKILHERYGGGTIADLKLYNAWSSETFDYEKFKAFLAMVMLPQMIDGTVASPQQLEELRALMQGWGGAGNHTSLQWPGARRRYVEAEQFQIEDSPPAVDDEIVVIVASHSGVMSEVCQMGRPNNNEVYERQFLLTRSVDGEHRLSEQAGSCHQVLSAPKIQEGFRKIAHPLDTASCIDPMVVNDLVDFPDSENATEVVKGRTLTKCMRMALGAESYKASPLAGL